MRKILLKYKWYIISIFGLIVAEPSLNSALNFWLQQMFSVAAPGTEIVILLRLLTIGFLLWTLKRLVNYASALLKSRYICSAKQDIKHRVFINLLNFDSSNLSSIASSGEYLSLFTNDVNLLETRFLNQIISLISNIFSIGILGASFFALNAKLASAILSFGIIAMFVPLIFSNALNKKNLSYSHHVSEFTQQLKEYLIAFPTIKNYSIEKTIAERFCSINVKTEDAKFETDYALNLANSVGQLMSWFMQFIGVGLGLALVTKGEITIGTVVATQSFASDLALPLQNIIMNINSICSTKALVHRFETLSASSSSNHDSVPLQSIHPPKIEHNGGGEVVFENLCLTLNDKRIIDQFSFRFERGKKYLIVGLNGSGKSSLFRALKRWFRECEGKITVNVEDISTIDNQKLSRLVSYMNENVSMFSGTVRDNISLFRTSTINNFERAVRDAQIHLDLDHVIGDEGRSISSGEQRRIEIARSLLESSAVLIFDEVISTLDIETAYEIEKLALDFVDKTVIVISHNFSGKLIRSYDEILVMDSGHLIAHGPYAALLEECEYFRKICEIKFGLI